MTAIRPQNWHYYYGTWDHIGQRAFEDPPKDQPLVDDDIEKLRNDGIVFVSRLGQGRYGQVWRTEITNLSVEGAKDAITGVFACKIMALKQYTKTNIRDAVFRLLRECQILKTLRHEHIIRFVHAVRLYDDVSQFPQPIFVLNFTELCNGNLAAIITITQRLTEYQSLGWFIQIASAVRYLHKDMGIAHLDIKPDNILFKGNLRDPGQMLFKLTDFGLSQVFTPGGSAVSYKPAGTRNYMAPEFSVGGFFDAYKADIYSLGMTLAESFAGRDADSPKPRMVRVINTIQKGINVKGISTEVQDLLRNMTIENSQLRFNIDEVLAHQWTHQKQYIPS